MANFTHPVKTEAKETTPPSTPKKKPSLIWLVSYNGLIRLRPLFYLLCYNLKLLNFYLFNFFFFFNLKLSIGWKICLWQSSSCKTTFLLCWGSNFCMLCKTDHIKIRGESKHNYFSLTFFGVLDKHYFGLQLPPLFMRNECIFTDRLWFC